MGFLLDEEVLGADLEPAAGAREGGGEAGRGGLLGGRGDGGIVRRVRGGACAAGCLLLTLGGIEDLFLDVDGNVAGDAQRNRVAGA